MPWFCARARPQCAYTCPSPRTGAAAQATREQDDLCARYRACLRAQAGVDGPAAEWASIYMFSYIVWFEKINAL
eukprot:scaffold34988_cov112-Isochrysis_galbana.AAC.3